MLPYVRFLESLLQNTEFAENVYMCIYLSARKIVGERFGKGGLALHGTKVLRVLRKFYQRRSENK